MKRVTVVVAVCVAMFAVVSPASGGPSVSQVAKKALKYAKAANKRSKSAVRVARAAKRSADSGVQMFKVDSGNVSAPPQNFARFDVKCPSGYVATGPSMGLGALELVAVLNYGTGYLGSYFNPSSTSSYSGSMSAQCAIGYTVTTASNRMSKPAALRARKRAEQNYLATH